MKKLLVILFFIVLLLFINSQIGTNVGDGVPDVPHTEVTQTPSDETTPTPEPEPDPIEIRIQFAGDVLLHRGPIDAANIGPNTYDFRPFLREIAPFIDGDLNIVNMETPIDVLGGNRDITTWPRFNAPFEILEALQYSGFNLLIAANNHSVDRGFDGLVATVENFDRVGIAHTGMYVDEDARNIPKIIDVNGIQVGVIAYTDSLNGLDWLLTEAQQRFAVRRFNSHNLDSLPQMTQDIEWLRERGAELVVVSLHYGAEYVDAPTEVQRQINRELSEAGADVIMGHHAHVVQPVEWHYREDGSRSLIMYDLGNFLADQTRMQRPIPRTQYGMLVSLNVVKHPDGTIELASAEVLPTLCMRDIGGGTLGGANRISVLPLFDGEVPEFITNAEHRAWGRRAYEHVVNIVGEEWIIRRD